MKNRSSNLRLSAVLILAVLSPVAAEEILIHSGPPVSTPEAAPITPSGGDPPAKEINFQRDFFVDRALYHKLPGTASISGSVPITAVAAIELAKVTVAPGGSAREFVVTGLQLLRGPEVENTRTDFYLVSMLLNGSEEHRIVLMDGTVLKPRLRRVKD